MNAADEGGEERDFSTRMVSTHQQQFHPGRLEGQQHQQRQPKNNSCSNRMEARGGGGSSSSCEVTAPRSQNHHHYHRDILFSGAFVDAIKTKNGSKTEDEAVFAEVDSFSNSMSEQPREETESVSHGYRSKLEEEAEREDEDEEDGDTVQETLPSETSASSRLSAWGLPTEISSFSKEKNSELDLRTIMEEQARERREQIAAEKQAGVMDEMDELRFVELAQEEEMVRLAMEMSLSEINYSAHSDSAQSASHLSTPVKATALQSASHLATPVKATTAMQSAPASFLSPVKATAIQSASHLSSPVRAAATTISTATTSTSATTNPTAMSGIGDLESDAKFQAAVETTETIVEGPHATITMRSPTRRPRTLRGAISAASVRPRPPPPPAALTGTHSATAATTASPAASSVAPQNRRRHSTGVSNREVFLEMARTHLSPMEAALIEQALRAGIQKHSDDFPARAAEPTSSHPVAAAYKMEHTNNLSPEEERRIARMKQLPAAKPPSRSSSSSDPLDLLRGQGFTDVDLTEASKHLSSEELKEIHRALRETQGSSGPDAPAANPLPPPPLPLPPPPPPPSTPASIASATPRSEGKRISSITYERMERTSNVDAASWEQRSVDERKRPARPGHGEMPQSQLRSPATRTGHAEMPQIQLRSPTARNGHAEMPQSQLRSPAARAGHGEMPQSLLRSPTATNGHGDLRHSLLRTPSAAASDFIDSFASEFLSRGEILNIHQALGGGTAQSAPSSASVAAAAQQEDALSEADTEAIQKAIREADEEEERKSIQLALQIMREESATPEALRRQQQQQGNVRIMTREQLRAEQLARVGAVRAAGPPVRRHPLEDAETGEPSTPPPAAGFRMNAASRQQWTRRDQNSIVGPNNEVRTKHDIILHGRANAHRLGLESEGNGSSPSVGNAAFNSFMHSVRRQQQKGVAAHGTGRAGADSDSTKGGSMDPNVRIEISRAINNGLIEKCNGVVKEGKEAMVYHAESGENSSGFDVAVKVFKRIVEFRGRADYVDGDPRYMGSSYRKAGSREQQEVWAEKEFRNLIRAHRAGVPVPAPLSQKENVLFMRFIGNDGWPAPQLRELNMRKGSSRWTTLYNQTMEAVKALYRMARLVHGDLSEYNILVAPAFFIDNGADEVDSNQEDLQAVLIDFGQAVDTRHPEATNLLRRDMERIRSFFAKQEIDTISVSDAMTFVLEDTWSSESDRNSNYP